MNRIWANRLIAGDKTWADVPEYRQNGVKTELKARTASGDITADEYKTITGEDYTA